MELSCYLRETVLTVAHINYCTFRIMHTTTSMYSAIEQKYNMVKVTANVAVLINQTVLSYNVVRLHVGILPLSMAFIHVY